MSSHVLQIHEFSRELIDITKKDGKYVSGGFGASEIAHATYPVPDKIKQALIRGDLRINDNYPPKRQEFALLAKEIDEYAILAVATGEHDDKNRPLIAYRYFWLEKPQENNSNNEIDGIGRLILWWRDSQQPKYYFKDNLNFEKLNYQVDDLNKRSLYTALSQGFKSKLQGLLTDINFYPYTLICNKIDPNSYLRTHYIALHLHQEFKTPLSWTWNVGLLEHPENFTIVDCTNESIYTQTSNQLMKYRKTLKTTPMNINNFNDDLSSNLTNHAKLECRVSSPQKLEVQLKEIVHNLANNFTELSVGRLINFLDEHQIHNLERDSIIDKNTFDSVISSNIDIPPDTTIRYRAILTLFGFEDLYKWFLWLIRVSKNTVPQSSYDVQADIVNLFISRRRTNNTAYKQLKTLIFNNISNLLLHCINRNIQTNEYKRVEKLLFYSESVWSYYFKQYSQDFLKRVIINNFDSFYSNDNLYQQLSNDIKTYQKNREKELTTMLEQYQPLAVLMKVLGNHSLSALFYQLSQNSVPKQVYRHADVQVIPLIFRKRIHPIQKFGNFIREYLVIITALLLIFTSIAGLTVVSKMTSEPQLPKKILKQ